MAFIKWIHLSDIHTKSNERRLDRYNSEVVLKRLWDDIDNRCRINDDLDELDFAFITGDLAWSGADTNEDDEYEEVYSRVIVPLSEHTGIPFDRIFIVPGNHDISRSKIDAEVESIENRLTERDRVSELFVDPGSFENDRTKLFDRLQNYANFVTKSLPHIPLEPRTYSFMAQAKTRDSVTSVRIIGLNSAWLSHGGTADKGKLPLGEPVIEEMFGNQIEEAPIIVLIHHPLQGPEKWFRDFEDPTIKRILGSTDFLLCGHVHVPDVKSQLTAQGPGIVLVGGSIYENRKWTSNSYNYVLFDTESSKGSVFLRRYIDDGAKGPEFQRDLCSTTDRENGVLPLVLFRGLHSGQTFSEGPCPESAKTKKIDILLDLTKKQAEELNHRPLLPQSHPHKDSMDILFPDVYVDPLVSPQRHPADYPLSLGEWLDRNIRPDMKVLLIGPAGTGKTTSLMEIHQRFSKGFLENSNRQPPMFFEARNLDWSTQLQQKDIADAALQYLGLTDGIEGLLDGFDPVILIDAIDEAFPIVYQEMGHLDSGKLIMEFPHIATCRNDFFARNLEDADFCSAYDEILVLEPWQLEREAKQFLTNYYTRLGREDSTEEVERMFEHLKPSSQGQDFPLTPLSVTAFLFLWLYEQNDIVQNPITSFASLMHRFSLLWARREVNSAGTAFRDFMQLFDAYEDVAWSIYLNRQKAPLSLEEISKNISANTGISNSILQNDRGLLSMLRLDKSGPDGETVVVISFVHEAIYELMIANKLVKALKSTDTEPEILSQTLGHVINGLARQMLSSLPYEEGVQMVDILRGKYFLLLNAKDTLIDKVKHFIKKIVHKQPKNKDDAGIIRRHNLCYFWGRIESQIGGTHLKNLYRDISTEKIRDHEMIRSTIGSGILLIGDEELEEDYLASISDNSTLDVCNRTYHRVYYGDERYKSTDTFLNDNFVQGKDDWPKTRQAILFRLSSIDHRSVLLRGLDIVTFRRLCETRGLPKMETKDRLSIQNCSMKLDEELDPYKVRIIRNEQNKLITCLRNADQG